MTPADVTVARAAGWTDEALYFAITVCALFNFYNRWIDASGVHALSDEAHRVGGSARRRTDKSGVDAGNRPCDTQGRRGGRAAPDSVQLV